ncbi:MAG: Hsp33 family molecular chaperone HslO [Clostridia bacterium]|nr:Hsp33 family molecular chaperone HslO [Clostridia bacterium]
MAKSTVLRGMTHDGSARVLVINSTELVNGMIRAHKTYPTASAALGRLLTCASMVGTMLPAEGDTLTVNIASSGEISKLIAVADYYGCVKGYINNPYADPPRRPDGKLNVGGAIGEGSISFIKDISGKEPAIGTVELTSGEIAEDIATYFARSEQIPTLLSLGVLINPDLTCKAAGGVLIQLMPFPDEETVEVLERNAVKLSGLSGKIADGMTNEEIFALACEGIEYDLFDTIEVEYRCDCERGRMLKKIKSLGKSEILKMLDEQESEGKARELSAVCRFCNSSYTFTEGELLGKSAKD